MKQKPQPHAIDTQSDDPRVNHIRRLARELRDGGALTPELQEAISDLNAEACRNFNRAMGPRPKSYA